MRPAFPSREQAFLAERQIKRWGREKKKALISGKLDLLPGLAKAAKPGADSSEAPFDRLRAIG